MKMLTTTKMNAKAANKHPLNSFRVFLPLYGFLCMIGLHWRMLYHCHRRMQKEVSVPESGRKISNLSLMMMMMLAQKVTHRIYIHGNDDNVFSNCCLTVVVYGFLTVVVNVLK
jgi:phosphotransferase system HPr-like phosphotransfer protein